VLLGLKLRARSAFHHPVRTQGLALPDFEQVHARRQSTQSQFAPAIHRAFYAHGHQWRIRRFRLPPSVTWPGLSGKVAVGCHGSAQHGAFLFPGASLITDSQPQLNIASTVCELLMCILLKFSECV